MYEQVLCMYIYICSGFITNEETVCVFYPSYKLLMNLVHLHIHDVVANNNPHAGCTTIATTFPILIAN